VIQRGLAEAEALKRLLTEYRAAGDKAREVLALQQLMPLVESIAGSERKTLIREWTVVPSTGDTGDSWVHKAIAAVEQVRAGTGIDLAAMAAKASAVTAPQAPRTSPKSDK